MSILSDTHLRLFVFGVQKQNRIIGMVHEMCTEMSHAIGKLVVGIGKLAEGQPS